MLNLTFREIKRVDLIENGKVAHYFKIKYLDNSTAVFDNSWNQLETSKIMENNMATKFQKRHYEDFAKVFKNISKGLEEAVVTLNGRPHCSIAHMISSFCTMFKKDNPQFSIVAFLDAIDLDEDERQLIELSIDYDV